MEFIIPYNSSNFTTSNICELPEYKLLYDRARKERPDEYPYIIHVACIHHTLEDLRSKYPQIIYSSNIEIQQDEIQSEERTK